MKWTTTGPHSSTSASTMSAVTEPPMTVEASADSASLKTGGPSSCGANGRRRVRLSRGELNVRCRISSDRFRRGGFARGSVSFTNVLAAGFCCWVAADFARWEAAAAAASLLV